MHHVRASRCLSLERPSGEEPPNEILRCTGWMKGGEANCSSTSMSGKRRVGLGSEKLIVMPFRF
jgi:hypothetical protein